MIVEVETVSFRSEPSEYIDQYDIETFTVEYKANGREYEKETQFVRTDRLDALIEHIDTDCIVQDPTGDIIRMDDATWFVRVYDGYNE